MTLFLDTGVATNKGKRGTNFDSCIATAPDNRMEHGGLVACADGIAERPEAHEAARAAVQALSESYFAAPENWSTREALEQSVKAAHQVVASGGEARRASSLSVLILRGRCWTVAHLGHTRVWLYREHALKLITQDHVIPRPTKRARIAKAVGFDTAMAADFSNGELCEGDIFLVTSDGVHDHLNGAALISILQSDLPAQHLADTIVQRALETGTRDSASVCVARVEKLPDESRTDIDERADALQVVETVKSGDVIDGYTIKSVRHKDQRYRIYKALDQESGEVVALKFPVPRPDQHHLAQSFLREEWSTRRISHPHVLRTLNIRPGRRTALYTVLAYHKGETLAQRLRRKGRLPLRQALLLSSQLASALALLHRDGVIHGDVRPNNLLLDKANKQLLLLGLGSGATVNTSPPDLPDSRAGRNYLAPELLRGEQPNERSDIYAAGVTLYRMLSGKYPYGKLKSAKPAEHRPFIPLSQYRADVPIAVEELVEQACAWDAEVRFGKSADFVRALERVTTIVQQLRQQKKNSAAKVSGNTGHWHWILVGVLLSGLLIYLAAALR